MNASMILKEELYKGEYFELNEAQEYLEVSKLKLREFVNEGDIKVFLMETKRHKHNKYFFKKEDLVEFKLLLIMTDLYSKKRKIA